MSYSHRTLGQERYEEALGIITMLGIRYVELKREWKLTNADAYHTRDCDFYLRKAAFVHPQSGRHMLIEEYVQILDIDCDGTSWIAIGIYPAGQRPDIESLTQVRD